MIMNTNGRCIVVFRHLEAEFLSISLEIQTKTIKDSKMMIRRRQKWTGVVEGNASMPSTDQGVHEEEYLSNVPEELADVSGYTFCCMTAEVEAAQSELLPSRMRHDRISATVDISGTSNTNTNNINDNCNDDFNIADTKKVSSEDYGSFDFNISGLNDC
jgi:hypothetical protein